MAERMAPAALQQAIAAGFDAIEALVANAPPAGMEEAALEGGWSVKDTLAHIEHWERLLLDWLGATARGETPVRFAPGYPAGEESVHALNAATLAANREAPLADVLARFRTTHAELARTLSSLDDAALNEPGRIAWTGDRPLLPFIAANTHEHYDEHLPALRAWLGVPG